MWAGWVRSAHAVADCPFMVQNLPCEFHAFHYLRRNRIRYRAGSSSRAPEMTMSPLSRTSTFSPANMIPWLLNLATRMLARSLNMPEPLVQNTGAFVYAQVQAVEYRAAKTFCPIRLLR